jgi:hypothetical protein
MNHPAHFSRLRRARLLADWRTRTVNTLLGRHMTGAVTADVCRFPPRPLWLWAGSEPPIWSVGDFDLV